MDGVGGACGEDGGVGGSPGVGAVCLAEERPDGRQMVHHEWFPEGGQGHRRLWCSPLQQLQNLLLPLHLVFYAPDGDKQRLVGGVVKWGSSPISIAISANIMRLIVLIADGTSSAQLCPQRSWQY